MRKIMLIPAALFVLCILLLVSLSLTPQALPEPAETAPAETTSAPETAPAETEAETTGPEDLFQRTAFPLSPEDEAFWETVLVPVADDNPPNAELQNYLPQQVSVAGSRITITAELRDKNYYSGRADSLLAFRYGTVSFRINCMDNPGLFPAVWMLPANGESFPEVDIYEQIGREPQYIYGVNHYQVQGPNGLYPSRDHFFHVFFRSHLPESYVITLDWSPEALVWSLDGTPIHTMTQRIPDCPMYLIFNLAVGGNWCGNPTSSTVLPAVMDVEILDFQPQEIYTR